MLTARLAQVDETVIRYSLDGKVAASRERERGTAQLDQAAREGQQGVRVLALDSDVDQLVIGGNSNCQAEPPKSLVQLLGGPPSGAGSRQMYQSRFSFVRLDRAS